MTNRAAILFSGGSDCTLVAAQLAKQRTLSEIVLLTYEVPFSCLDANSKKNIPALEKAFPHTQFIHEMLPISNILDKIITKRKLAFIWKYGLIEASVCLHCRLAMHTRTIIYCLEHGIRQVFDGSNVTMALWVDQTSAGIRLVDDFYQDFGIEIHHPVFYYAGDDLFDLLKYLSADESKSLINKSTSQELHAMQILATSNHKSDLLSSYRAQPVCLGVVMSLMHSLGYSLPFRSYQDFQQNAISWYREKIDIVKNLVVDFQRGQAQSELGKLL